MIFKFTEQRLADPLPARGGMTTCPRAEIAVFVCPPDLRSRRGVKLTARIDTGSDAVIFPDNVATVVGARPGSAGETIVRAANGGTLRVRYAPVHLTLKSPTGSVRWEATVGFAAVDRALFGFAGGLEFFHTAFDWPAGRILLNPLVAMPVVEHSFPGPEQAINTPL